MMRGYPCNLTISWANNSCHLLCYVWVLKREKMTIFCKSIHYYHNGVIIVGFRQPPYEVHNDVLPNLSGNGKRLQQTSWAKSFVFVSLAHLACYHKISNITLLPFPIHYSWTPLVCPEKPRITSPGDACRSWSNFAYLSRHPVSPQADSHFSSHSSANLQEITQPANDSYFSTHTLRRHAQFNEDIFIN